MRTLITAHSGCEGLPDNSLEFIRFALHCGADALEVDVRRCPGGGLHLSHDPTDRPGVRLSDAFSLLSQGTVSVNCDLKESGLETEVLEAARSFGLEERLWLSGSVSSEALPRMRERTLWNLEQACPQILICLAEQRLPSPEELRCAIRQCQDHGARFVNLPWELCTSENLELFQESGLALSVWTVDKEVMAKKLLEHGVFNLTTRCPLRLLRLRETICGKPPVSGTPRPVP